MNRIFLFFAAIIVVGAAIVFHSVPDTPTPAPTPSASPYIPDPRTLQILAAGNPFASPTAAAEERWIRSEVIDPEKPAIPGNLIVVSKAEPVIAKEGDVWTVTFKP